MPGADPALSLDTRRHFLHALRRVLRPIIRLLIRHGIGYAEFADVARGAFVESAIRCWDSQRPKPTREQIAQITGIPRQRVSHYVDDENALPNASPTLANVLVEVLHKWHTDPRYLNADGTPTNLELDVPSGSSFRSLVAEVNDKVSAEAVLDALLHANSVTHSTDDRIRATRRCFIWPQGDLARIEHFGTALSQLIGTYEYNLNIAQTEDRRLERSVFADNGLPAKLLPQFQAHATERTDHFLLDIDDWLARSADSDTNHLGPRIAAGVNVFLYVDPPADPRPPSTLVQPRRDLTSKGDVFTS